uniref:Lipase (Class 3) family-like protein n=1 Tax=Oryza sativa subsp. japonica TaxID=39947 RepID=Q6Z6P4_ORYSJ|nr:lipase (class 3) family -like protein [Oryza sativa Japonica Group]BAD31001.1 lipase (class 3) family -like protein [Oryza sativa Japonica Group]
MASSSDVDLADSGPVHMMAKNDCTGSSGIVIDWDKEEHRHCVAACLVKGVMVMMKDRSNPLAPAWWKSFGFRCRNVIKDDSWVSIDMDASDQGSSDSGRDDEIFGATYEYEPPARLPRHPSAPSYVVAFRGTIPTNLGDLIHDIKIVYNTFSNSNRCDITHDEVEGLLQGGANSCTMWLAGHSLGASQALDVGRSMAEKGFNLPTFLFNPPQVSPAPAIYLLRPNEKAKMHLYATSSLLKGYVDYFEQRQLVQERFPSIGMSAMKLSYRDMFFSALNKDKERSHLLPSALLWENSRMDNDVENHPSKSG